MVKKRKNYKTINDDVVRCSECGSTNVFQEVVHRAEWIKGVEHAYNATLCTCANRACGHSWEE